MDHAARRGDRGRLVLRERGAGGGGRGAKGRGTALHLLGLLGNGGVHASDAHLRAVLKLARDRGLERVFIHPFTDGRDTDPHSARGFLHDLEQYLTVLGTGRIATVSGRYYAMDRDRRWDRVARAYAAIVEGEGQTAATASAAIEASYAAGVTDEFVVPTVITDANGAPTATIGDGDAVIFTNFRNDRARELTHAIVDREFDGFARRRVAQDLLYVTMVEYEGGCRCGWPSRRRTCGSRSRRWWRRTGCGSSTRPRPRSTPM